MSSVVLSGDHRIYRHGDRTDLLARRVFYTKFELKFRTYSALSKSTESK